MLSSSAKADDPVLNESEGNIQRRRLLDHPLARVMTGGNYRQRLPRQSRQMYSTTRTMIEANAIAIAYDFAFSNSNTYFATRKYMVAPSVGTTALKARGLTVRPSIERQL
jgi:hypothetical protein